MQLNIATDRFDCFGNNRIGFPKRITVEHVLQIPSFPATSGRQGSRLERDAGPPKMRCDGSCWLHSDHLRNPQCEIVTRWDGRAFDIDWAVLAGI